MLCSLFCYYDIKGSICKIVLDSFLYNGESLFFMPRNQLTKDEINCWVLKCKNELYEEKTIESKVLAHKYLDRVLSKIAEYGG